MGAAAECERVITWSCSEVVECYWWLRIPRVLGAASKCERVLGAAGKKVPMFSIRATPPLLRRPICIRPPPPPDNREEK